MAPRSASPRRSARARSALGSFSIIGESSQCVTIGSGASRKMPSSVAGIVDQHVAGRRAHEDLDAARVTDAARLISSRLCSSRRDRSRSWRGTSGRARVSPRSAATSSVGGCVFGMSMKLVTPPATAARDSVAIVGLVLEPGLAAMHLVVDQARQQLAPAASISRAPGARRELVPIVSMRPSRICRSPSGRCLR